MPVRDVDGDSRVAYRKPQPAEMAPDLLVWPVLPSDERIWVLQAPNVWFRPLCLSATQGYWVNLLKVTRAGVPVPPSSYESRARLRTERPLALPGARLGGGTGSVRV